jgi:hypothetical protein
MEQEVERGDYDEARADHSREQGKAPEVHGTHAAANASLTRGI